jgi:hypothetical protein
MIAAVRWALLLAALHSRPGWQILTVVALAALAGRLRPRFGVPRRDHL